MAKPDILRSNVSTLLTQLVIAVTSGLLTTVAAATATAGHVFAWRWSSTTSQFLLRRFSIQFVLTTAFGTAQEVGFDLIRATAYTVAHTGGTALDLATGGANRLDSRYSASLVADSRIGTTGALTAGTHTLDAQPIGSTSGWMGAIGATIAKVDLFDARDLLGTNSLQPEGVGMPLRSPLVLRANEGVILRNTVLMGATGVGRLQVFIEGDEVTL